MQRHTQGRKALRVARCSVALTSVKLSSRHLSTLSWHRSAGNFLVRVCSRALGAVGCAVWLVGSPAQGPLDVATSSSPPPVPLAAEFEAAVSPRLQPPPEAVAHYTMLLDMALDAAVVRLEQPGFVILVDRSPQVQALLLFWGGANWSWHLVGAAPVSTGLPGRYDHFATPLGVFDHAMDNPDFRAEGTKNDLGIRGYGRKGARVYDFGWVDAPRGWGEHAVSVMRLQMHATDPDRLEQRLGTAQSKGCIRIPESLDAFLDRFGCLDEDYDRKATEGRQLWILRADRTPTPWSGRYLVVDSLADKRPDWSPQPGAR